MKNKRPRYDVLINRFPHDTTSTVPPVVHGVIQPMDSSDCRIIPTSLATIVDVDDQSTYIEVGPQS